MSATTLAVVHPPPSYTAAEMRARSIMSRMDSLAAKLKTFEDDIRLLWIDFDNLKAGETILGCATKKEFCEKKLHRTPRAIQYMLAGGNPDNARQSEIISPVEAPTVSNREAARQKYRNAHPESSADSNHEVDKKIRNEFLQGCTTAPEAIGISPTNRCPTGKEGFDYPDDIWQIMRAEGTIGPRDFIAYIGRCGQCGRCHRDKDQSGHEEGDVANARHQTWYRPDELNHQTDPAPAEPEGPTPAEPQPTHAPESKSERTLEDMLDKLVERIALQPYGYYATKFAIYPEQHTTDLAAIELNKLEIWQRIVEIGQAKLTGSKHRAAR
jgi:hypothetical protein